MIDTPNGLVPIEQIKVGDDVYAFDLLVHERVVATVARVFVKDVEIFGVIELEDGTRFEVTAEHPFYLPQLGIFENAGKLKPGDKVLRETGSGQIEVAVKSVDYSDPDRRAKVHNFHVPYYMNYFVNGVLVHNIKFQSF
jgi:hypothetical protein